MAFRFVAVGTSLGGFAALQSVLGRLPKDFPLPIGIVQHRSIDDSDAFAPLLSAYTSLPVVEVDDKQKIEDGRIYVCPANYHMMVEDDHFALSTDGPVMYARPSIDVFFDSAADAFGEGAIAVLLTGMSKDGTAGLQRIKARGGFAVVQDPAGAEGQVMPRAAITAGHADKILSLHEIAPFLVSQCTTQRTHA